MSNRLNTVTVSLVSSLLVLAYYLVNWLQMYRTVGLDSATIIRLWVIVIVATIIINIAGNIIAAIVVNIAHAIRTRSDKEVQLIEDERDKLIDLKGTRISYIVFSIGVFLAMLTFAFNQPPLIMFSLIVLFSLLAEIAGDIAQLSMYRRGVAYG